MLTKVFDKKNVLLIAIGLLIIGSAGSALADQNPLISQEKLGLAIKDYIQKNMPWQQSSARIEFLSRPPVVNGLSGNITFRIESKQAEGYVGDTTFSIGIFQNGVLFKEESVRVRIEVLRDFIVSSHSLAKDTILSASDITIQKKWVRSIPLNVLTAQEEALGKTLSMSIRPNTEILRNMVKEVMAVKRGKIVQVYLDNGPMQITATGLSEEDGIEGAVIKVRNLTSNKIIYATVVGQAKVKVEF
jgi:flagella basal body P-ring formation protein FlgA